MKLRPPDRGWPFSVSSPAVYPDRLGRVFGHDIWTDFRCRRRPTGMLKGASVSEPRVLRGLLYRIPGQCSCSNFLLGLPAPYLRLSARLRRSG